MLEKRYVCVCVDDFSRFTRVNFLRIKFEAFEAFEEMWQRLYKDQKNILLKIGIIRSDHGKEFENSLFKTFCNKNGIEHEFSAPKTPQENGVVKRKYRTPQEMIQVIIKARSVPTKFWEKVVNTTCYFLNRVYLRLGTLKTSYGI